MFLAAPAVCGRGAAKKKFVLSIVTFIKKF